MAGRRLAIAMLATFCVAGVAAAASAPIAPDDLIGRWVAAEQRLTLDVSRCGDGWCGVEVKADASCGRTQLRVGGADEAVNYGPAGGPLGLSGQLQLAANTKPYQVRATLSRVSGGALGLFIAGNTGGKFALARRTYDFQGLFARTGDPVCKPDPKVS
jgi:hypothetical protein